jgi:glucose/arabinose dehydrogenase
MRRVPIIVTVLALILVACGGGDGVISGAGPLLGTGPTTTLTPPPSVEVIEFDADLTGLAGTLVADGFERPADARAPIGDDRLFVVDQPGTIYVVEDGETLVEPFLDLSDEVSFDQNEQGLVTIAFHPRFFENRRFFVVFTDLDGDVQLVEYLAAADDPNRADPDSARPVLTVEQPHIWHQSGSIAFGPDGYLWISFGDGGFIGDPNGNGQNPENLLATIVRLDVDAEPYAIPPDNPFVDVETDELREIWAYGVRNPWRITVDHESGLLYIPDVGQEGFEELDVVRVDSGGGFNFGWSITEGTSCYFKEEPEDGDRSCDATGITMPIYEYGRSGGCAIVGGPVYRGAAVPELHGTYFFADYCGGSLKSFRTDGGPPTDEQDWMPDLGRLGNITSIGTDGNGELIVATLQGEIYRIDPVRR